MNTSSLLSLHNAQAVRLEDVPDVDITAFLAAIWEKTRGGDRLSALFGTPDKSGQTRLYAILADDEHGTLACLSASVLDRYPSLTPDCPQAHWFEREIAEQWGIVPEGHPWLKPIRFHHSYREGHELWSRKAGAFIPPSVIDYFRMTGEEVHQVAVGPIHAGVIEPGSFRFQCHGETVFHLEISLGYQHRGIERRLVGGPNKRTIHYMETAAGDTSIGHTMAYCQVVEALAGCRVPARAHVLRGIGLELERLANHTGDLGGLATDVAYLPTASYCGRLRGDWLNMTGLWCGNRFGRSALIPGGVRFDITDDQVRQMEERTLAAKQGLTGAANLLFDATSVLARFEDTGTVSLADCNALGLVGPAARACGAERDVRHDFPSGIYRFAHIPISAVRSGDVFARAYVRWLECQRSVDFLQEQISTLPRGAESATCGPLAPNSLAASLVEGWRGEICHVAITDAAGMFSAYKIVDPSFHNWAG
ncbi:MAG: NADH-quinone oxidoreductase subunit C, partial [Deltaproteobacteria bacterium]